MTTATTSAANAAANALRQQVLVLYLNTSALDAEVVDRLTDREA